MTGIADLTVLSAAQVPGWLARASLPAGWRVGHYLGSEPNQPWRIAVRDPRPGDGWDACETITVWGFTGSPTTLDVRYYCESTMGGLDAEDIVVIEVETPAVPGVCAVSGGGYFDVGERTVRGQHNFFVMGSQAPGQGRLVQQCLYVDPERASAIEADLALLGDSTHKAFVSSLTHQH